MVEKPPELILASQSPRRADLLRQMGFVFRIQTQTISESAFWMTDPEELVTTLSSEKARAVADEVTEGLVVGADTVVCLDGKILGKPGDIPEAKSMLRRLSGRTHDVFTGFTMIHIGGGNLSDVERTAVTFRDLTPREIDDYAETGSPLDKAGAYGIQDRSGLFVDRIDGCFYNVVGFPLTKFYQGLIRLLGPGRVRLYFR